MAGTGTVPGSTVHLIQNKYQVQGLPDTPIKSIDLLSPRRHTIRASLCYVKNQA